jgi:hypothetical protein
MKCSTSFVHYKEISFILAPSKSLLFLSISVYSPESRIKANWITIWWTLIIVSRIIVRSALSPYRQRDSFTIEHGFLNRVNLINLFLVIQIEEAVFELISSIWTIFLLSKLYFQTIVWKAYAWFFTYLIAIIYLRGIFRKNFKICKVSIK